MSDLVTNLNIKQPDGSYESHDIGVEAENVIGLDNVIEDIESKMTTSFKGTHAEWEALTTEEKAQYTEVIFTDDYTDESVMQGATGNADGAEGMVPQPLAGDQDKVLFGDGSWKRINNDISNLAPAYDSTLTYDVGDLVTYIDAQGSGKMYKCIVAVTEPEAFNINKWDDVTVSEVLYKSKVVSYHRALTTETYRTALNALFSNLTINKNKEYLFVENTSSVTKILHSANISANTISFSMIEITSGTLAVWDYLLSNSSLAHRSTINTSGYTDTSYTNNNWSSERDLYIIELATIID